MKFRKKPVVVEATQWWENGDHPGDGVGEPRTDPMTGETYEGIEGVVVRFFRRPEPEYAGQIVHEGCGRTWHDHGWIDTLEGGHTVCPGDWIITGVQGENYPCKPDIFDATYDPILDDDEPELGLSPGSYGSIAWDALDGDDESEQWAGWRSRTELDGGDA